MRPRDEHFDVVIVGSGPGGAGAAAPLVESGVRVLMLEAGTWVPRSPANRDPGAVALLSEWFDRHAPYDADTDGGRKPAGQLQCVGGQSVFFGAVAFRNRAEDFAPPAEIVGTSDACWPIDYSELEPWYGVAERLLCVSGTPEGDPTEPWRSTSLAESAPSLTPTGHALHRAARRRGLSPFAPPLAIARTPVGRPGCTACARCDGHACSPSAKGDAATIVTSLVGSGLVLRTRAIATRLVTSDDHVVAVEYIDLRDGRRRTVRADHVVLAAGALATPHLLLASGLQLRNPAGRAVGRYLTRHCNAVVVGAFGQAPGGGRVPYKEFAVHDFYFGHPSRPAWRRVGTIQQTSLPDAMVAREAPAPLRPLVSRLLPHLMGLLVMCEDQPVATNAVSLDRSRQDAWGRPTLRITHRFTDRDRHARAVLQREAAAILRAAGARLTITRSIDSFTHALGTVRMGLDPATSPLDAHGRFRGFANLFVSDASALPTAAAVNPALTIMANALRIGAHLASTPRWLRPTVRRERWEVSHAFA
ncbi:MAG TPA: GMC family oxidoreductase [Gemmatimonadales bacterium]|nr:GMC family oxidoreductase [Gemmatimonadales bacterium]